MAPVRYMIEETDDKALKSGVLFIFQIEQQKMDNTRSRFVRSIDG